MLCIGCSFICRNVQSIEYVDRNLICSPLWENTVAEQYICKGNFIRNARKTTQVCRLN